MTVSEVRFKAELTILSVSYGQLICMAITVLRILFVDNVRYLINRV